MYYKRDIARMIFHFIKNHFVVCIIICIIAASCKQINVYEKNTPIPHYKWQHDFPSTGTFSITDIPGPYNIYIVLRHVDAYKYNNIWLKVGLQPPGDTMYFQNINLTIATDAAGWEGSGMNDIWEVRKLISRRLLHKGQYKFSISQVMRDNPLDFVMSVGMRITKD